MKEEGERKKKRERERATTKSRAKIISIRSGGRGVDPQGVGEIEVTSDRRRHATGKTERRKGPVAALAKAIPSGRRSFTRRLSGSGADAHEYGDPGDKRTKKKGKRKRRRGRSREKEGRKGKKEGKGKRKMEDGGGREKKKEEVEGQKENTLER